MFVVQQYLPDANDLRVVLYAGVEGILSRRMRDDTIHNPVSIYVYYTQVLRFCT